MAYPDKDRYIPNKGTAGHSNWQEGDYVTAANMNHIEDGIDQAVQDAETYTDGAVNTVKFISGNTAPTTSTVGTVGQKYLYTNGSTKIIYECVDASNPYKWEILYRYNTGEEKWYRTDTDGDIIDISTIIGSIADAYDNATLYSKGAVVSYNEKLYRAKADTSGHAPTDTTYWEETNIADLIDRKADIDGHYSSMTVGLAEGIESDRVIEDAELSCPPITFGTTGGDAEIQTGNNKFKFLYGNSKKWNQLLQNGNFVSDYGWSQNNSTLTVNNNVGTFVASAQEGNISKLQPVTNGHTYLFSAYLKTTANPTELGNYVPLLRVTGYGINIVARISENKPSSFQLVSRISTATSTGSTNIYIRDDRQSNWDAIQVKNVMCIDLTSIYGAGNEPTTIDEFKKDYPLDYYPYSDYTILDAQASALKSRGRNQWDEQWEVGSIDTSGNNSSSTVSLRSKNFIHCLSNTEYYFQCPVLSGSNLKRMFFYDANNNFISYDDGTNDIYLTPVNAEYFKFVAYYYINDYTTYNNDICIYINWDTPGLPYVTSRIDTVTLPNIELRSIGDVRDEAYQEGGGKRYVGIVTSLKSLDWQTNWYTEAEGYRIYAPVPGKKGGIRNISCSKYPNANVNDGSMANKTITGNFAQTETIASYIYIKDNGYNSAQDLINSLENVILLFERETPTDITTTENPGWTELVYTDNYGTLEFLTDPIQVPQVPQPYYIEYTVSLVDFLDATYVHADGDAENLALKQDVDDIVDGNTPAGKALLADNLESNNKIEDLLPYIMRQAPSGVGASMLLDHLTGATVAWNQKFSGTLGGWNTTRTQSGTKWTVTTTGSGGYAQANISGWISGHKYLISYKLALVNETSVVIKLYDDATTFVTQWSDALTVQSRIVSATSTPSGYEMIGFYGGTTNTSYTVDNLNVIDLTQLFGSTIANYLYNQGSAGVNKFRILFPKPYYPYNAVELVGIKTAGRKAIGINQWDEQWELGDINASGNKITGTRVLSKNFIPVVPETTYYTNRDKVTTVYFYDGGQNFINQQVTPDTNNQFTIPSGARFALFRCTIGYGSTYLNDICINISDASINGTFYPYEADEYPCEEVELNGLYKLDANNNLYCDGDIYKNDGTITRRYIKFNLGSVEWIAAGSTGSTRPFSLIPGITRNNTNFSIEKPYSRFGPSYYDYANATGNKCANTSDAFYVTDSALANKTAAEVQSYFNGVYAVFELATSTEETASSFASTQKTGVTEQFMEPETPSTVFLPVGHDSFYLPDLKDKLEVAPDSPTTDGVYVVSRSGGTNVYIPIANVTATQAEIDEIIAILE